MRAHWDDEDLTGSVPLSRNLLPTQASIHCQIHVHIYFSVSIEKKVSTFETEIIAITLFLSVKNV